MYICPLLALNVIGRKGDEGETTWDFPETVKMKNPPKFTVRGKRGLHIANDI